MTRKSPRNTHVTAASSVCHVCGSQPRPGARFCDACGSPLAPNSEPAEYKQVTVLFADVVRSMDIAAALGPERLREVMTELVDRSAAVVQRYGGTVDKFTGDGIMALFGAPITFEHHAFRACLAALDIQEVVRELAVDVGRRDGIDLRLRVGLNSGRVITGEVGASHLGYTAVGEQVGMAQRMESVAPPGGIMLSESTARLVEDRVVLGERETVHIKGFATAVPARRLLAADGEHHAKARRESPLVGRQAEKDAVAELLARAFHGEGTVVTVTGRPGVGKTRLVRESLATARRGGFEVFITYCESHTREIAFHVVSRLLRAIFGIGGLTLEVARARVRSQIPEAGAEDLVLLDDLLGIRNPDVPCPDITPDARRRRLIDLITTLSLARPAPAIYVIEDAQWIDSVSESLLAEFAEAMPEMRATLLVVYRPQYAGALARIPRAHPFALAPLSDSHIVEMIKELLGQDPSVLSLASVIADRAAGLPFAAEEIVRDLVERGELEGAPGAYVCVREVSDIRVPASLQGIIGSRIDRLSATAKRTLHAAAVVGAQFDTELLSCLLGAVDVAPLIEAALVEQIGFTPHATYAFCHPLIQAVAYESQLKADRAELHRRVAAVLQRTQGGFTGQEASIVATQYAAAGDLRDAYEWYMQAATWYGSRDIRAARGSWQQALRFADRLPDDHPDRLAMRIAPRALLCGSVFQVGGTPDETGFDELRSLTTAAGDKKSLAVGMAGHITTLTFNSKHREAAAMAMEFANLVESIGDPEMTVGLFYAGAQAKWEVGEATECLQLAERIIEVAHGDPTMGDFVIGSPLAWAITLKGAAKMFLGRPGWRDDLDEGIALAHSFDSTTRPMAQLYKYAAAIANCAVLPDADDLTQAAESLEIAQRSGDNTALAYSLVNQATVLIHCDSGDTAAGLAALAKAREMLVDEKLIVALRRMSDIEFARERARSGDLDGAIDLASNILAAQFAAGTMIFRAPATTALVEALLARGRAGDVENAERAVNRLAEVETEPGFVLHEIPVLRLRALLARAHGDEDGYRQFLQRFRARAREADFEGYLAQADAMAQG
ncbi:adenylate and guanylate cyclase catalytic domain-containing protein [Mycobacterium rhizamassiliense]|uniref:Adenylate and guanylate cyclase catalytic domain-containing protein n=1 Tax=Mycobacterium rhizamassiliense TaxID=1841860 RepID=A0A2U3NP00_9MYCO|nr:adenylate and guanylate cyclase catalytic domain-containing protein [Mycobacterium rhizamassiliense]